MKRKNTRSSTSKKVRVKIIDEPTTKGSAENPGVLGTPKPVAETVENITFTITASGHVGQSIRRRTVVPNPAESVLRSFSELNAIEVEDAVVSMMEDFPVSEAEVLQDASASEQSIPVKKMRLRPDLWAAVSSLLKGTRIQPYLATEQASGVAPVPARVSRRTRQLHGRGTGRR